jgi:ABC-type amino acid transport substrate-binding protein
MPAKNDEVRRGSGLAVALACALLWLGAAVPAWGAGTLDKIKESGKVVLGYSTDAAPYAYTDSAGAPAGYAVTLCGRVVNALKVELGLPSLAATYVPLERDNALAAIQQGKADLLCGAVPTLERRATVDFSIPIMLSGASVAVRNDAPARIMQALQGTAPSGATWRGSTDQAPVRGIVTVIGGSVLEQQLTDALKQRRVLVEIQTVNNPVEGVQMLAANKTNVFFGDHAALLDAVAHSKSAGDIKVLDRIYRRNVIALALRRDDDFRLAVDRALSRLYRSGDMTGLYTASFGKPSQLVLDFFQLVAIPD